LGHPLLASFALLSQHEIAVSETKRSILQRLGAFAVLVVAGWWGLRVPLPEPEWSNAPATEFSTERAMRHVQAIASRPHPAGSPEAAAARDYVLAQLAVLGIPAEVQRSAGLFQRGMLIHAGHTENVVARLNGTSPGPAILLACHYDSVALGPGAADDGHAVGVLLETARALKAGPPLKNDVIFLFDVEETGMTGADAFTRSHPWRNDVKVALNFEARGTSGPDIMFQTSSGNAGLIHEFAEAVPYPVATSLSYEVYKRLPNDTDMSVFKQRGYAGFDFAFIDNVLFYHTPFDDPNHLDPKSVQHAGTNALGLTRRLGNADLQTIAERTGDAVYFSVGGWFVHYATASSVPFTIAVCLLLVAVVRRSYAAGVLSIKHFVLSTFACLVTAGLAGFLMVWVWRFLWWINPGFRALGVPDLYARDWHVWAYFTLTTAILLGALALLRRVVSVESFAAGGVTLCALLLVAATTLVPGASYMLLFPVFGGTLALLAGPKRPILAALFCFSAMCLMLPFAFTLFTALLMPSANVACATFALMLMASAIPFAAIAGPKPAHWMPALVGLAVVFAAIGVWANEFNAAQPRQDDLNYVLECDTGQSWWMSATDGTDAFLKQFLGKTSQRVPIPFGVPGTVRRAPAPKIDAAPPELTVVRDESAGRQRVVDLKMVSHRNAQAFLIQVGDGQEVSRGAVEGIEWTREASRTDRPRLVSGTMIYYTCPGPDGAALRFTLPVGAKLKLRIAEGVSGLPQGPQFHWAHRGAGLLAAIGRPFNDSTVLIKSYEF
jgi:hypothetical protein